MLTENFAGIGTRSILIVVPASMLPAAIKQVRAQLTPNVNCPKALVASDYSGERIAAD